MDYKLIALDMDGTLLTSDKQVSQENRDAVDRGLACGKHVVLGTGRSKAETLPFYKLFPRMRYAILENGSYIYDIQKNKCIYQETIPIPVIELILAYIKNHEIMPGIMIDGHTVIAYKDFANLADFQMTVYRKHFADTALFVSDPIAYWYKCGMPGVGKICLFHKNEQDREESVHFASMLPVTMAFSEQTCLELSPLHIDKGSGLEKLCELLSIPVSQSIAVGDSFNDISMLQKAGLAVGMGNTREGVRAYCDVFVRDNDHHGVQEAIDTYLIGGM